MSTVRSRLRGSVLGACVVALLCATALVACAASSSTRTTSTVPASPSKAVPPGSGAGSLPVAVSTVKLALELLPGVSSSGNAVISPYSVQEALAMVDQGARGQTAAQIERVLGVPGAGELAASNRAVLGHLAAVTSATGDGSKQPQFTNANGLWLEKSLKLKERFVNTLGTQFGAAPTQLDFQGAPEAARSTINGWVAHWTEGHIPELFPAGSITSQTLLVLANAIYLKAQWQNQFDSAQTGPAPFYEPSGSQVSAKFMTMDPVGLPYAHSASYRAVEFPYLGSSLSMLAVMPTGQSMATFMKRLTPARFGAITSSLKSERLRVYLPRLDLKFHSQLNQQLSALGMPDAFGETADLTGISAGPPRIFIGTVQHAATLQVTEAGTVASAATGIGVVGAAVPVAAPVVKFDHPFLLFLRDNTTRAVLFAALVVNPLAG